MCILAPKGLGTLASGGVPSLSSLANAIPRPETKRKAYFAFRFEDIMRVNNVRKAWCIDHPDTPTMRSFYDRSIWDKSAAQQPEALKTLMRNAVIHSSAVCVLVGTNTWQGRWVKYEIARAVIDGRGLLAVHINSLSHINRGTPDPQGYNPLKVMGIYHDPNGNYYLYEMRKNGPGGDFGWRTYLDYTTPVSLPQYIPSIPQGLVMPLSAYTSEYDFLGGMGHANIGAWIDAAATAVGR